MTIDNAIRTPMSPLAERARQLDEDERFATRERLRDQLVASAACILSAAAGLALLGFAVHTTDPVVGRIAFFGGLAVGNAGILTALVWVYARAERRGDG